jgi:hypothetical protein
MLVAYRLAGLSALGAHYAGVKCRAIQGGMGSEARHNANLFRIERSLLAGQMSPDYIRAVPTINLTDDELAAVTAALRRAIEDDRFPHAPRLDPLRAALEKLEAAAEPSPPPKAPPPAKPTSGRGANRREEDA